MGRRKAHGAVDHQVAHRVFHADFLEALHVFFQFPVVVGLAGGLIELHGGKIEAVEFLDLVGELLGRRDRVAVEDFLQVGDQIPAAAELAGLPHLFRHAVPELRVAVQQVRDVQHGVLVDQGFLAEPGGQPGDVGAGAGGKFQGELGRIVGFNIDIGDLHAELFPGVVVDGVHHGLLVLLRGAGFHPGELYDVIGAGRSGRFRRGAGRRRRSGVSAAACKHAGAQGRRKEHGDNSCLFHVEVLLKFVLSESDAGFVRQKSAFD